MFNIYDIVLYRVNFRTSAQATINKCQNQGFVTDREEFEQRFGLIQNEKCYFDGAYNEIISDTYMSLIPQDVGLFGRANFHFFTTKETLWVCNSKDSSAMGAKWYVTALLIAYVLSQRSNNDEYKNIKKLGCVYNGSLFMQTGNRHNIEVVDIKDISDKTFASICRNCIGYNTFQYDMAWRKSSGTNMGILRSLYNFYKDCLPVEVSIPISTDLNHVKKLEFKQSNASLILTEQTKLKLQAFQIKESSFNRTDGVVVDYISDIHLEHHIDSGKPIKPQIVKLCMQLMKSRTSTPSG